MDLLNEGESTSCPPLLEGTKYGYSKVQMLVFIKSLDMKAWRLVFTGWCPPTKIDADGKTMVKNKLEWTDEEDKSATNNLMALNLSNMVWIPDNLASLQLLNRQRKLGTLCK